MECEVEFWRCLFSFNFWGDVKDKGREMLICLCVGIRLQSILGRERHERLRMNGKFE